MLTSQPFCPASYASFIGHHSLISYFAVAENESIGRMKYNFMEKVSGARGLLYASSTRALTRHYQLMRSFSVLSTDAPSLRTRSLA